MKPTIRWLARRGGVKRISGLIYEETKGVLKIFLENVIRDAVTYTEHARRKIVTDLLSQKTRHDSLQLRGLSELVVLTDLDLYRTWRCSGNWSFASTPCSHWTEISRFQYGDSTVSMYEAEKNSVVQITQEDYIICNATSPVSSNFSDGYSVLKLNQRGPSYFISGIVENCKCKNNGTIAIVVITDGRPLHPSLVSGRDSTFLQLRFDDMINDGVLY
ncbi:early nodulin-like protein 9 [Artemisia annua]|uniref:Histone H4 n=1 Tax=Artemisia annua TaxID=35608 RepID=A0A2U1KQ31_ARTAN|nr:early nodulin-like protein 9 [Artemisia annua]